MPRPRNPLPAYLRHPSGRARVAWTDAAGVRHFRMLPGPFDSLESRAAYRAFLAELEAAPHRAVTPAPSSRTVADILLAYLDHAERHYLDADGNPTDEVRHVKTACRAVRELYADTPAESFGPLALKAVRQKFIDKRWSRKVVNARVERVKRVFRWAVAEELVPPAVYQALVAVEGLRRGRTPARETEPVTPVDDAAVDATLPHLHRHVRGLVTFQRLTGCRPSEACRVRRCDIDTGGAVWLYKPARHKTQWRGKSRTIAVGPRAQRLLREFFTQDINDYLFSPWRAVEELVVERGKNRKTPKYPSHMRRNEKKRVGGKRKRPPAERYTRRSYLTAVARACDRAFPPDGELARRDGESAAKWWAGLTADQRAAVKEWRKSHRWHPNQLRHSFATRVRREFDLEAAGAALGHTKMSATEIYAARDEQRSFLVASRIG